MVVGAFEHATFDEDTQQLWPGDVLVAYSDGVTEARDSSGEEFGEERLLSCVQANCTRSPWRLWSVFCPRFMNSAPAARTTTSRCWSCAIPVSPRRGSDPPMTASEIVAAALAMDPFERAAYVRQACGADRRLLEEADELLRAHTADTATMAVGAPGVSFSSQIGPYKLIQQIGEGGMGVVYHRRADAARRRRRGAQGHQARDGQPTRSSRASRASGRRWR